MSDESLRENQVGSELIFDGKFKMAAIGSLISGIYNPSYF